MISILVVNDKADLLDQVQGELRACSEEWSIRTAASAQAAKAELGRQPTHIMVSDLAMPSADDTEFLEHVRRSHPSTVRFALTGEVNRADANRAFASAHQVFAGSAGIAQMCRAIAAVAPFLGKARLPAVQRAIEAASAMPPLPPIYSKLREELARDSATSASVARIIELDPAISSRLLQMANSPYFGFGNVALTVREAVTRVGLPYIQDAVLLIAMQVTGHGQRAPQGFSLSALQARSEKVASTAAAMLSVPEDRKIAFSAGMLHHIGYFVLALRMPEAYEKVAAAATASKRPLHQVETELLGCDHAQVGAFMLTLLGLPVRLVEAVAHHHQPSASSEWFGPAAAVHVACLLAAESEGQQASPETWDQDFLDGLPPAIRTLIDQWRAGEPIKGHW